MRELRPPCERRYRIVRGDGVRLVDDGRVRTTYCIHPSEYVPYEDTMLAQMLLIENDEEEFLLRANVS